MTTIKAVKSEVPDRYDVYIDGTEYWHGTESQVEAITAKYGFTVEFTQELGRDDIKQLTFLKNETQEKEK